MHSSTSKVPDSLCSVCQQCFAIYKCPLCAIRTCSLPCSKSHKSLQACSGERDKTAYVPMNKYGWGTMANDYTYLEEVGRKAAEWGFDIAKGGYLRSAFLASRGRGRGRGNGLDRALQGGRRGKRDILRMQLDARDIDMEILPQGMERRRVNQSTWEVKSQCCLMTVEFVFHQARNPLALGSSADALSFTLLTHRNNLDTILANIVRRHVHDRGKKDGVPPWVKSLISSETEDSQLIYLMSQLSTSPSNPVSKEFYNLDPTQSLLTALQNKTFVEYPTFDIWEEGEFTGGFFETDGRYVEGQEEQRPVKRRRVDAVGGRKMIESLLEGYTSNGEDEQEEGSVMDMLGGYGSDEEFQKTVGAEEDSDTEEEIMDMLGGYGSDEEFQKTVGDEEDSDTEEEMDDVEPTLDDVRNILEDLGHESFLIDQSLWQGEMEEEGEWSDSTSNGTEEIALELER